MKEAGYIEYTELGAGSAYIKEKTAQCSHCGAHFTWKPQHKFIKPLTDLEAQVAIIEGKKLRGWCMNCNGPVCGPGCIECVPAELYLDNLSKGRDPKFKPVSSAVPIQIK